MMLSQPRRLSLLHSCNEDSRWPISMGFKSPAANRLLFGGAMCVASVLAVVLTWYMYYASQPGGVRANLDYWECDLPRISYMGASPPAYYVFCTLIPLATLIVRAPLLNLFRATKQRLEATLWQLGCADIEDPEAAVMDDKEGGVDNSNNNKSGSSVKRAHTKLLRPSATRAMCCGCGWQRCCCGCCWAIDTYRASYGHNLSSNHLRKPENFAQGESATLSNAPFAVTSEPSTTSLDHASAAAVLMESVEQKEVTPLQLFQPYARPPCCGRNGACGVYGIFCGLGFRGVYLPYALAALEPLAQISTTGLPLLAIASVEWPYPSTPLHGLGAVTFFYGTIMFNGLWLAIINEAERLLGPTRVKQELGYSRHARFNQCHRALFRVQVYQVVGWDWVVNIIVGILASASQPGEEVANFVWRYGTALSQWLLVLNLASSIACFASAIEAFPLRDNINGQPHSNKAAGSNEKADATLESNSTELNTTQHSATRCTIEVVTAAAASITAKDHQALLQFCLETGLNDAHHAMLVNYGIDSVQDAYDTDILTDEALISVGFSSDDIAIFRRQI